MYGWMDIDGLMDMDMAMLMCYRWRYRHEQIQTEAVIERFTKMKRAPTDRQVSCMATVTHI
jgi:hypothetical protein